MPGALDYNQFLTSLGSVQFAELWPAQALVLQSYAEGFTDNSDVAIELPTGGGKTLIALLIAEAWRREGRTVAILSANKTLARQLAEEADSLGIPRVVMEGSAASIPATRTRAFQRAEAVAVMNYWVYFNQNPVVDPADLLIMDDAHLMEECLHSLYSVEIEKIDHPDLFRELASELLARFPEYSVLADALDDEAPATKPPELLSFIDQIAVAARFTEIIDASPALQADQDLAFRWHRLRGSLQDANIYLSSNSLWIRPYVYPLIANPHYDGARQRIYMSATIGIPGDLQRRLGIRALTQIPVAPEHAEKTFGRRLIVLNRIDNEDLPERVTEVVRAALQVHPKSVWLCSSKSNANKFQALFSTWLDENGFPNQPTWVLTPTGDEIDRFKESQSGHLFVGGRFDGMDFAGDQCRLVVLTTLPRSINIQEEFISAYLRDSGFMKSRLNQRIVQAMGRCNRSENDYAVYVLADKRFATHFSRESNRVGIPKNIQAEIDIAQDSAEADLGQTVRDVRDFLGGNFERYDRNLATSLESLPPAQAIANVTDTSDNEVIGWTALFDSQNYVLAAQRFERCTDTARQDGLLEISALHGWNWSKAVYLESMRGVPGARARALAILDQALHRGGRSAWFNRMRTSLNRAWARPPANQHLLNENYGDALIQEFDLILEQVGATGHRFERYYQAIEQNLTSLHHDEFLEGLKALGQLLAYSASRPRHQAAADCRWKGVFSNSRELVTFEAKIEHHPANNITPSDVGQAHNHVARATAEYGDFDYIIRGTIVTHLEALSTSAESSAGSLRVIPTDALVALWHHLIELLSLYRERWSLDDVTARRAAAEAIRPRFPSTGWLIRALDGDDRFVRTEDLVREWS